MIFSPQWFTRHQKILLWFANSWIGRRILCINGQKSSVGKNKILKILPDSITWFTGEYKKDKRYKNPQDKRLALFSSELRTYGGFGKRLYFAFYPLWKLFHLWDMAFYPNFNLGFDTLNAVVDNANGDGRIYVINQATWGAARDAATGTVDNTSTAVGIGASYVNPNYGNRRGFFPFGLTTIPVGSTVTATVFKFTPGDLTTLDAHDDFYIVESTQASATSLDTADYNNIGSTSWGSKNSSTLSLDTEASITLNATGIAAVQAKIGSNFLMAFIGGKDLNNSAPTNKNYFAIYCTEQTGTTKDPKLVVTYTLPMGGYIFISS